jgi:hypothetical protein
VRYGEYTSDDGLIVCALWIDDDTYAVMGFASPAIATYRRPADLLTRKQVFVNSVGKEIRLVMPTTTPTHAFPTPVTIRGDATYIPVAILGELNRGEAS